MKKIFQNVGQKLILLPGQTINTYWIRLGKPSICFIFTNKKLNANDWPGATLFQIQNMARKLRWEKIPSGHRPRLTLVKILFQQNINREKIINHFGWIDFLSMLRHHAGDPEKLDENSIIECLSAQATQNDNFAKSEFLL